jgi:hypothetical protein
MSAVRIPTIVVVVRTPVVAIAVVVARARIAVAIRKRIPTDLIAKGEID